MSPIDVQDILERAKNSSRVGDHEQTARLLKNYLTKVPESREARLLLGTAFAKEGKLNEAADEFIALLARDPQDIEALNNAAVICRRQGKLEDALEYLKEAIDIDPLRVEFHYNAGNIHKQLGNFKAASMAYGKVIELDPAYVPAYNNLGTIYDQLREYDKAFGVFCKGLALDQNNPTIHFNYGVALEANGRLEDAAGEYRAALRSKPGWLEPMNNLGIVLFKQGRHDKAMSTFNRILDLDPLNAEARNNMGVVLADQGRTGDAIKSYRQAIEADPKYTRASVNLERVLESSGDFADAVLELEKLVKLSPDSAEIRSRLASLYLKMERYPEALEQAESALEWEPDSIQALWAKGAAQRIMGNDSDAQACFERILALDSGNYNFLLDLADIHFRRKEYKEAEERLQAYLIRRPNDREAKLLLGRLLAEMGNRTHAIQVFEELTKADPNDAEVLAAVAELHKKAGSLEKALRTADTLVNLQGKRATAEDLTELNKSLEFYENAVNAYSGSVKEMWKRNIKLLSGDEGADSAKADVSQQMGAAALPSGIDEETESFLTENPEVFAGEETEEEPVSEDDTPAETEEEEIDLYFDPFAVPAGTSMVQQAPPQTFPAATPSVQSPGGQAPAGDPFQASTAAPAQSFPGPAQPFAMPSAVPVAGREPRIVAMPAAPAADTGGREPAGIVAVIELFEYFKALLEEIPREKLNSPLQGKLPETLDSVIDSLRKLVIIKESVADL